MPIGTLLHLNDADRSLIVRASLLVAPVILIAAAVAGCSTKDNGPTAPGRPSTSSESSATTHAHVSAGDVRGLVIAAVQRTKKSKFSVRTSYLVRSGATPLTAEGVVDFSNSTSTLQLALPLGSGFRVTEILSPTSIFIGGPNGIPPLDIGGPVDLPPGKWAEVPRATQHTHDPLRGRANDSADNLTQLSQADDLSDIGEDSIDGVVCRHVRGYLSRATLTQFIDPSVLYSWQRIIDDLGSKAYVAEAWINPDGTIRRLKEGYESIAGSSNIVIDLTSPSNLDIPSPPAADSVVKSKSFSDALLG